MRRTCRRPKRYDGPSVIGTGATTPRNALRGLPIHKVDLRVTKRIKVGRQISLSGVAEVFNLFDHANYGGYNGQISSPTFGAPASNPSNSYRSRTGQLAFRLQF